MTVRTGIVLINYNNIDDTRLCLASLAASEVPLAIVVVDNASRGDEAAVLRAEYPHVHVIASDANIGFGRANNLGLRWLLTHTDVTFLFVLNNDTVIESDTVEILEQALDDDQSAGVATARIVLMENADVLWYGGGIIDWRIGTARVPGFRGPANSADALTQRYVTFASGCAMLFRRSVLESVGGFDPRYFMYEEDVDLSIRVVKSNQRMLYVPRAIVHHKGHGSQPRDGNYVSGFDIRSPRLPFMAKHLVSNRLLSMYKHARGKYAARFLVFFPLWFMRHMGRFVIARRWSAIAGLLSGLQLFWTVRQQKYYNELSPNTPGARI